MAAKVKSALEEFGKGVRAVGKDPAQAEADDQERSIVQKWLKDIKSARAFDEFVRKLYAFCRRYAAGERGQYIAFAPIAPSYIEILRSILFAKNPDLDITPAGATEPPPMHEIIDMAREQIATDPATEQQMQQVGMAAQQAYEASAAQARALGPQSAEEGLGKTITPPPLPPGEAGQMAAQAWLDEQIKEKAEQILKPYHDRLSQAKQFGKTLELVIRHIWRKAKLKMEADDQIGSTLTIGLGWLKVTWQERQEQDPTKGDRDGDLKALIDQLAEAKKKLDDGAQNEDVLKQQVQELEQSVNAGMLVVVDRGLAIDFVRGEDVQVATSVPSMRKYLQAPWIAHRSFMLADQALAKYTRLTKDDIGKAMTYYAQKPRDPAVNMDIGIPAMANVTADEADSYRSGAAASGTKGDGEGSLCVWEIWNKERDNFCAVIEGVDKFALEPVQPDPPTSRFYPFFMLAMLWADGQRHPVSLVQRSFTLFDAINRLFQNRDEHQRRAIPKTAFDKTNMSEEDAKAIEQGTRGEMIGLEPITPGTNVSTMVAPIQYNQVDERLYDKKPYMEILEIIWGIQEALASSIQTAKTATEAEIEQTGTNARTTHKRAAVDDQMDDLAQYTAEVLIQKLKQKDAEEIAGPWALWPENVTIRDMGLLVDVKIKGGSSGQPDTSKEQQVWSVIMPLLQNTIMTVGKLRNASPTDIADCMQELVQETLDRSGERLDATRFIPPLPSAVPGQMPPPAMPGAPGAPLAPPGSPQPMPAQMAPPTNPDVLPVPHNAHNIPPAGPPVGAR